MTPAVRIEPDDGVSRRRIRSSLEESLLVEAAAGTGKTTELVLRMVAMLQQGLAAIDRMVAVTFTHKAAGELKLRLRQELDRARSKASEESERRRLEDALARLEEARVGTIHSFCADILRERPVEARVDPSFQTLSDYQASRLFRQAFRSWIHERLEQDSPGLRRCLARLAWRNPDDLRSPLERLQEAGWRLAEWRDFPAPWRREPFPREADIDGLVSQTAALAQMRSECSNPRDALYQGLRPSSDAALWIERGEQTKSRDYDAVEALLLGLERDLKRSKKTGRGAWAKELPRAKVVDARAGLLRDLDAFRRCADAEMAALLQEEMQDLGRRYEELKRRSGRLDFVDLLIRARDLIRGNAEVRGYLQTRFTQLFVDEFQDVDPLQAEILLLLSADDPAETRWQHVRPAPGKLFAVGDPKQSIYRFRRADVAVYETARAALESRGVATVRLSRSFRAVRPIQQLVNAAFEPEMTGARGQPRYVPLQEYARPIPGQPAVIALPPPRPYKRDLHRQRIEECLPDAVAAFVEWLLRHSGWEVRQTAEDAPLVPVAARHVCILFRRFQNWGTDMTRDYARALEARSIPHLLLGSRSFHQREEVETLRAALTAVEWPDDELSVFAVLKGPLFAIPDEILLGFRHAEGRLHPFHRCLREGREWPEDWKPVAEVLSLLAKLHRQRNRRPVVDTIHELLEAARAQAGLALRPAGNQVLANVYRVCDLARRFELSGGISFRGFVEELAAMADREEKEEAPALEEGAEGVRLMTVHTAKGLEFPVVVLADMTAHLTAQNPDRYLDAERGLAALRIMNCAPWELLENQQAEAELDTAEGVRVAYVGATRARDLLVIPAVGDRPIDGWLSPLSKAIYPAQQARRRSAPAPGCPAFGPASVLERPMDLDSYGEFSVRPGLHHFDGGHSVVWWDPGTLKLEVEGNFGVRREELLIDDGGESKRRYEQWKKDRQQVLEAGARPQFDVFAATAASEPPPEGPWNVELEMLSRTSGRPSGRRFGTLVHAVLREADLGGSREGVASLAGIQGRLLGSPQPEVDAAVEAVWAALGHPLLARARAAARCHRELPLLYRFADGRLLDAVLDLAFLDNGVWTVVDFKTDAELQAGRDHYERQVQWYLFALSRITGLPAEGRLLGV